MEWNIRNILLNQDAIFKELCYIKVEKSRKIMKDERCNIMRLLFTRYIYLSTVSFDYN